MRWLAALSRARHVGSDWYRRGGRVDSRIRVGDVIAARVRGRRGVYEVFGSPRALDCTCGAGRLRCPHVRAVAADFEANAQRFSDLRRILDGTGCTPDLARRELLSNPGRLIDALRQASRPRQTPASLATESAKS